MSVKVTYFPGLALRWNRILHTFIDLKTFLDLKGVSYGEAFPLFIRV